MDIVERLRDVQARDKRGPGGRLSIDAALARDAANEIGMLRDVLIGAEAVIRMLAPTGQETTLETIRRALLRERH